MGERRRSRRELIAVGLIAAAAAAFAVWRYSPGQQQKRQLGSLIDAAAAGDAQAVEAALAAGVDVNARDADGTTPLMHAARGRGPNFTPTDHAEVVELLIQRGADVNAKTDTGFVALFWAARYGHDGAAKVLIDRGADVNARDKDGITALKWASTNEHAKLVELLTAAGATQ